MKINTSRQWVRERTKTVSCCRCWLLSCETRHDVQSAAERREHPAGLQGGQEEPGYSRYSTAPNVPARCRCWELSFLLVELFFSFFFHEPMFLLPTVSYINYGPFTSYAPTYDSSFANISKEESDLIYSSYGNESSPRGSDRYVQRRRTRALWHSHKTSGGIPERLLSRCFRLSLRSPSLQEVRCTLGLILTGTRQSLHFSLSSIIISWYAAIGHSWHPGPP